MGVPCRWLADYVDFEVTPEAIERLAKRLTLAGLEVEGITTTGTLHNARVGRVVSCRKHPNSDHLTLCTVDVGSESVDILCGASNVIEDALVPVVLVGGELPGGLRIEKRKIRGEVSNGMICSKQELGLEDRSEGIWIFDPALRLTVGTDLRELLEYDDFVFDFKVASNRPDCASIYGVAREIAAILNLPLQPLQSEVIESAPSTNKAIALSIEDPMDTPRYAARLMENVQIGPSPLRIQHRLIKAGMRPLSNVVDATNYVMLELGQPLHPFDADLVRNTISIRRAVEGESFRTLDGLQRRLSPDTLLIADEEGPLAIAGVMGGERSEIRAETTRVLLEIAVFRSYSIRQSSRSVGLRTEASQRFERGLSPEGIPLAATRAAYWIQQLTGCEVRKGLADAYPNPSEARSIRLRPSRTSTLLGVDLGPEEIRTILRRLEIPASVEDEQVTVQVPFFRPDLEREVDLIEEVGRIYGYDRFPSTPPRSILRIGRKEPLERGKDRIREILISLGLSETLTDGFDKPGWREALGLTADNLVTIRNPMTATQSALRASLLPGLLSVVETNLNRGVDGGMIFELGHVFSQSNGEQESLAGILFGRTGLPLHGKETISLSAATGLLNNFLSALALDGTTTETQGLPPYLHPGRSARYVREDKAIGLFGELSADVVSRFAHPTTTLLFEFEVEPLLARWEAPISYVPMPRFPASKRDLSVSAPVNLPEARIRGVLLDEPEVASVLLYDVYRGEQVDEAQKSLTYEIAFRATDRTLTDAEVSEIAARIEKRLLLLGVSLRT